MLTIFAIPKPFKGSFAIIQRNAIKSWKNLSPEPEVLLLGNESGTAEAAQEMGCRHIPQIACNEYGTPLLNSLFFEAERAASHSLLCYVNADIILMSDFIRAIERTIHLEDRFLLISHRWDLDLEDYWDFSRPDWESRLRHELSLRGKILPVGSSDYFVFPRGQFKEIPAFSLRGRGWDNWLIFKARSMRVAVIDATEVVTAVHQSHELHHDAHPLAGAHLAVQAQRNNELYGPHPCYGLNDATHRLTARGLGRAWQRDNLIARLYKVPAAKPLLDLALQIRRFWRAGFTY